MGRTRKELEHMTLQTVEPHNGTSTKSSLLSAEAARRQANGYLVQYVSTGYRGVNPEFITATPPVWQVIIQYKVPTLPPIRVGYLEINAQSGAVIPLSAAQIATIRERAREYLAANAPSPAIPHCCFVT
jgi:hypothetical protein